MNDLKYKKINCILLFLLFFVEVIDNMLREMNYDISFLKNTVLVVLLLIFFAETITIIRGQNIKFSKQFRHIIYICIIFSLLSLYFALKQHMFSFATIIAVLKIFIPGFIAYVVLNTVDYKSINALLKYFLVLSFIAYFILILPNLNISNIKSISFINSNSPFESNYFSPISFGLFIYFFYFSKKKWPIYLSLVLVVLNFKRPMIATVILTMLLSKQIKSDKKVSKAVICALIVVFISSVYVCMAALGGKYDDILIKFLGVGINKLTMGRAWLFENTIYSYTSGGLATSPLNGRTVEMDLVMFYLEMGIISIIAYVYNYYIMCERKMYLIWIITITLFISLTSHFYDASFYWILLYLTMGLVLIHQNDARNKNKDVNEGART